MRKLVVVVAGATLFLCQLDSALAKQKYDEGECIRRCYVTWPYKGYALDNCLIACINKFPNGLTQIQNTPLKPEVIEAPSSTGHRLSANNVGTSSGLFTGRLR